MASSIVGLEQGSSAGRDISMGLLHFCMSCQQVPWWPLFWTISSKMFVVPTSGANPKYFIVQLNKDNVSLQSIGRAGVQPIIKDLCSVSLRLFNSDTNPFCTQHPSVSLHTGTWDLGVKGANTSMKLVVLRVIKFFASDLGIQGLRSAFMNCGTLTCKLASRMTSQTIHRSIS